MQTKLRHIILLSLTGYLLLASCSTDDAPDDVAGAELRFAVSGESRSSVTTDLKYPGSVFSVFGDMKLAGSSSAPTIVFNGTDITYDTSTNPAKWVYSNTQYWFPKHEHSFVAVHPAIAACISNLEYDRSELSLDCSLPDKFDGSVPDLMVATHRRLYNSGTSYVPASGETADPVLLKFSHIMSRINFSVKNDGAADKITVDEIVLDGIYRKGTMSISPASLQSGSLSTDDYNLSWPYNLSDKGTLTFAPADADVADGKTLALLPDADAMFVIPQPDNNEIITHLTYTLHFNNGHTEQRTLKATTPIGAWEVGKAYSYSISLKADDNTIEMTVTVDNWKPGTAIDDVTVPRK